MMEIMGANDFSVTLVSTWQLEEHLAEK